jgi:hypothetical protein
MNLKTLTLVLAAATCISACGDPDSRNQVADRNRAEAPRSESEVSDDHGNTAARATDVVEGTRDGTIAGATDVDWFRFVPTETSTYAISTEGALDTQCTLYDVTLRRLAHDDDSGLSAGCKIERALDADSTYFLRVAPQRAGDEGDYTLIIEAIESVEQPVDPETSVVDPQIALAPAFVTAGGALQVSGEAFTANSRVTFEVNGPEHLVAVAVDTDEQGNFAVLIPVPETQAGGRYQLRALDIASSQQSPWIGFNVNAVAPQDVVDPDPEEVAVEAGNGGRFEGELPGEGAALRYRFTADRTGAWRIYTEGTTDTVCTLIDSDDNSVANNDDGGEGTNCLIEHTLAVDTDWVVQVAPYGGRGGGAFTLVIEYVGAGGGVIDPDPQPEPEDQADDHGDDPPHATLLLPILPRSGELTVGDVDVFQFIALFDSVYTFTTIGFTDTHCSLIRNNGALIVADDNSGILLNCRIERRLEAGDVVFVAVRHGHPNGEGNYTLIAVPQDDEEVIDPEPEPQGDDHGDDIGGATEVAIGTHAGQIDGDSDRDFFSFTAADAGIHTFTTTGDLDLICRLLDADGEQLSEDDDGGEGLNCRIRRFVAAGTTVIFEVRGYSQALEGAYSAVVSQ